MNQEQTGRKVPFLDDHYTAEEQAAAEQKTLATEGKVSGISLSRGVLSNALIFILFAIICGLIWSGLPTPPR